MSWFRNTIANLYAAVSAPVAATRDGVLKRLRDIRGRVTNLYNKVRGHPPQKTLKDIVGEAAYDGIEDVKHMYGRAKAGEAKGIEDVKHVYGRAKESRQGEGLEDDKHMYGRAKESRREEGVELIENGHRVKTWCFLGRASIAL